MSFGHDLILRAENLAGNRRRRSGVSSISSPPPPPHRLLLLNQSLQNAQTRLPPPPSLPLSLPPHPRLRRRRRGGARRATRRRRRGRKGASFQREAVGWGGSAVPGAADRGAGDEREREEGGGWERVRPGARLRAVVRPQRRDHAPFRRGGDGAAGDW